MKFIKWLLAILVVLLVLLAVVGFFLPQKSHVERSLVVNATMDETFNKINGMQAFNSWSPWVSKDPNAVYEYTGPEVGVGSKMSWSSEEPDVGNGTQEIIESIYPRYVKTVLYFNSDDNPGYASFTLEEVSYQETRVTWSFDVDFGNQIVGRYFGLMMDNMLGPEYEKGLQNLKSALD